jgi:hypothetical protein
MQIKKDEIYFQNIVKVLKEAQVVSLHKKNSQLEVGIYRHVSILPVVSTFFERAIYRQLSQYFENIFHPFLSAFRPGFGCNTAPLKIINYLYTS